MEMTGGINAAGLVEVIALTGVEVVCSVRGCGVDGSRALIGSDVGGEDSEDIALKERMLEGGVLERATFEAGEFSGRAEFAGGDDCRGEFGGDDINGVRLRAG